VSRRPVVYVTQWVRGRERRTFSVAGWNKDDAYVASLRALEAAGEDPRVWWYVGADRRG